MTAGQVVWLIVALLGAVAAVMVVASKSPVRSVIALVFNFFVLGFLYFTLGAHIIGITQILVYAGAIMVLFLFVVMLLHSEAQGQGRDIPSKDWRRFPALLFALGLGGAVFSQVILPLLPVHTELTPDRYGEAESIGRILFTQYAWPFEVASVLLLIGIVGSILLAKRRLS